MSNPWMKFFPSDWRADPALRICGMAARGLWVEILAIMHEATPRGHLLVNGVQPTARQLAALVGAAADEVEILLAELEEAGVFSRKRNGVIYSRRMERDEIKASKNRANGRMGGNPALTASTCNPDDNPPPVNRMDKAEDKTQKPEARGQKPEKKEIPAAAALYDPPAKAAAAEAAQPEQDPLDGVLEAARIDVSKDTSGKWFAQRWIAQRWHEQLGLSWPEITARIAEIAAHRKGWQPPGTLKFFDPVMQELADRKAQPPLKPQPGSGKPDDLAAKRRRWQRIAAGG